MSSTTHLNDRAVIRISGDDRRDFLQGLVTQDLGRLSPDSAVFAALLTPQGKILFDFFIVDAGDSFLLDCHADAAPALAKRLTLYKLRAKVSVEIDESLAVAASVEKPDIDDGHVFADPRLHALGYRAIVSASAVSGNASDYHQRRIALGVPELGQDFGSEEMFLLDVNYDVLNGVSYKKGCFVGQEVTSRMKRKGEARRRTLIAAFDGKVPKKGASVVAGESNLGDLMSGGNGKALALIRLDRLEQAKAASLSPECEGRPLRLHFPDYLQSEVS